jgi:predicted dehydrogenase
VSVRVGLLSTARINALLVAGAREAEGVEIAAVASRDPARARAQADELGIERAHGSYEELLGDPAIDAVYISLPNAMHVPWTIRALEAGKHVLCEKPLSRSAAAAQRAREAAERTGLVLAEAFMWRHHPQAKALVELLPRLGTLRAVRAQFSFPLADEPNIRLSEELEGGALMDVGCYCVSAARLLAGEPVAVHAEQVTRDGVDVRFAAVMRHEGDVLSHFDCAFDAAHRHELEVVGSEATALVRDPWHSRTPVIELGGERLEIERRDPYGCELEDFAAAIGGAPHPFGAEDAVAQAAVVERLYASAAR